MLIKGYTDYDVTTKTGLGGTKICFDALTNDQIDFYPEYTGTGLLAILQPNVKTIDSLSTDKNKTYHYVEGGEFPRQNIISNGAKPIGFNNAYALMMREKQAKQLNIKTISDLKRFLESK